MKFYSRCFLIGKERSQNLKLAKLKTVGTVGSTPLKIFAQPQPSKPKGLSIRSKSDLNVSVSTNFGFSKQVSKDCMNLEDKTNVSKKPSLSPIKIKTPKVQSHYYVLFFSLFYLSTVNDACFIK